MVHRGDFYERFLAFLLGSPITGPAASLTITAYTPKGPNHSTAYWTQVFHKSSKSEILWDRILYKLERSDGDCRTVCHGPNFANRS